VLLIGAGTGGWFSGANWWVIRVCCGSDILDLSLGVKVLFKGFYWAEVYDGNLARLEMRSGFVIVRYGPI